MPSDVRSREAVPVLVPDSAPDGELDFGAVGRALWRKKLWVLVPTLLVVGLAFAAVNVITPRYKSEARIILEGRENVFLRPDAERGGERERAVVDQEAVNSQVQLALSREVAREVIRQLKLTERPEFDPVLRGISPVKQVLIVLGIARDPFRMTPEERVFETYYERVQAYQVEKSRVIAVEFQSADPELAARGANAVAEAYIALLQVVKQNQTKAASEWLAGEIETLRTKVSEAESKVEQFRSKSNLFVGTNNNTLSNQQLGEINSQLASARAQKAEADAKAQSLRGMLRAGRPIEAGEIVNSELIRRLNEQRVTLRAQLAEQSSTLLGGHPRIKELRAQIADLERQIRSEAELVARTLENDARTAGGRVEQLSRNLEQLKRQAASTNEQDVQLRALEREAKSQRDLLESYLAKYREAAARETLGASPADARIISRAIVSNTPYFPKKLPIVLIASFATLLLGAGFITTGELLAGNVYRPGGVAASLVPAADGTMRFEPFPAAPDRTSVPADVTEARPASNSATPTPSVALVAEQLRARPNGRSKVAVIGLEPNVPVGDVASSLARELSATGRTVSVDLSLAEGQGAEAQEAYKAGIADLVRGKASFGEIISRDSSSRAHRIASGDAGDDRDAVLASERLPIAIDALERTYEHVVLDFGPTPDVANDRLARLATGVVLVTRAGMNEGARTAEESLREAGWRDVFVLADDERASTTADAAAAA